MHRVAYVLVVGSVLFALQVDDFIATEAVRTVCKESHTPGRFWSNKEYRRCVLDDEEPARLARERLRLIEKTRAESLLNIESIRAEAIGQVERIGKQKFVPLSKPLPSSFAFWKLKEDPFHSGEFSSRLLKIRFAKCSFWNWRPSEDDPDPTEFYCEKNAGRVSLQGNKWRTSSVAKYVNKTAGPVELFVEVISIPQSIGIELRYEVHGFTVSEAMVNSHYDELIALKKFRYGELIN